jgi:hypothetical protein
MTMDLRCPHKLHAVVLVPAPAVVEIACGSRWCGKSEGVVVLHRFNAQTGALIETKKYRQPERGKART